MKDLFLLAALICFGMAAIKFCTARMKPNHPISAPKKEGMLTPEDAKQRMEANPSLVLLDVRTQPEFNAGHIPGAVCLPLDMISDGMPFPFGKDAEIVVYCRSGRRSTEAAEKLHSLGFTHVSDLGGIVDWPYETVQEES